MVSYPLIFQAFLDGQVALPQLHVPEEQPMHCPFFFLPIINLISSTISATTINKITILAIISIPLSNENGYHLKLAYANELYLSSEPVQRM
jgi:hypothetical protein